MAELTLLEQIKQLRSIGANKVICQGGKIREVTFESMKKSDKLSEIEKLANLSDDDLLFASSGG
jgi:hypothetical protein